MVKSSFILSLVNACGAIVLVAAIVSGLLIVPFHSVRPAKHDDWRRTASGWERASGWLKRTETHTANKRPPAAVLEGEGATQQFIARARYADGTERDITN